MRENISLKWMKLLIHFCWLETNFLLNFNFRQSRFTYSACRLFTKHRERIQKMQTNDRFKLIVRISKRTLSDKVLKNRAYQIELNPTYNE